MRTIEDYSEPSKTMKKSTLKTAIFIHFHIFCYVIRVGKFFHCAVVRGLKIIRVVIIIKVSYQNSTLVKEDALLLAAALPP